MKLYMCHPFDSRFEMRKWELSVEVHYDIEIINPFYDLHRDDVVGIDDGRDGRYEKLDPEEIVTRDIYAIQESDGVIAYVNGDLSYGTIMEIVYAYEDSRPVYIICTNGHENHPWLVFHATEIFTSKEDFEEFIARM